MFGSKANHKFLKQVYFRTARALKFISSHKREPSYLEALSPEEVKSQLEIMGLDQDWTFTDFDEAMVEQSSQHLWAKAIIKKKRHHSLPFFSSICSTINGKRICLN